MAEKLDETPPEEILNQTIRLISNETWVIDGVSYEVMEAADTIVFIDVPRLVSCWRILKRNYKYLFRSRPELPPHCPEILIIPTLIKIIWQFPGRVRPKILIAKEAGDQTFVHITSKKDLDRFLQSLE